ncbi:MAG: hypothetical protein WCS31_13375 [Verrucomicrobiae bacterium]
MKRHDFRSILASLEARRFRAADLAQAPKTSKPARLVMTGYLAAINDVLRILTAENPTTNKSTHP